MKNKLILLLFTTLLSFYSCNDNNKEIVISADDYHKMVDKLTSVMVHDIFSPPVASRIYSYPFIASYETLNQNNKNYKSLSNQLIDLKKISDLPASDNINLRLASSIAYLDVAKELVFSKNKIESYRDSLYNDWNSKNKTAFQKSKEYGLKISSHIINWMHSDKYAETRTMPRFNTKSEDASRWQPTPPAYMEAIEPHWNKIRTFVLDSSNQFKPKEHPEFSLNKNSEFYKELVEVYAFKKDIENKTEEVEIASFWDCNPYASVNKGHFMFAAKKITPGAHWIGICKIASKKSNSDFEKTVFAYTKTSIAISDAFISCWDEKYRSNLIRPETLINQYIDDQWEPVLQTPPFPEYTSGHSVVSGAASKILTSIFGDNFSFDDTTEVPYNLPIRKFTSFNKAAQEAAISRFYGGIHYMSAVENGLIQGNNIGNIINKKLSFR